MKNDKYILKIGSANMNVEQIHAFLTSSYWAKNIPLTTVQTSITNSLCFGIFVEDISSCESAVGTTQALQQVAFARVITDKATFAYLGDVFVVEHHRGNGLSKRLMTAIDQHPDLQGLRRFMLATSDAHSLYQQFGFNKTSHPDILMERWEPNIYTEN